MCGRYTESKMLAEYQQRIRCKTGEEVSTFKPRYNIAPTQDAPVVFNDGERTQTRAPRGTEGTGRR